jgi:hypothetical protein
MPGGKKRKKIARDDHHLHADLTKAGRIWRRSWRKYKGKK